MWQAGDGTHKSRAPRAVTVLSGPAWPGSPPAAPTRLSCAVGTSPVPNLSFGFSLQPSALAVTSCSPGAAALLCSPGSSTLCTLAVRSLRKTIKVCVSHLEGNPKKRNVLTAFVAAGNFQKAALPNKRLLFSYPRECGTGSSPYLAVGTHAPCLQLKKKKKKISKKLFAQILAAGLSLRSWLGQGSHCA